VIVALEARAVVAREVRRPFPTIVLMDARLAVDDADAVRPWSEMYQSPWR